jgi:hypothetical protein
MGLLLSDADWQEMMAKIKAEDKISYSWRIKAKQQNEQITKLRIEKFRLENTNSRLYYQNEWLLSLNLILAAVLIYRFVIKKRRKS